MRLANIMERELKLLAMKEFPKEACAILTDSGKVIPITNVSKTPEKSFSFSPSEYAKFLLQPQGETFSIWHSHVEKKCFFQDIRTPSEEDILLSYSKSLPLWIAGFDGKTYSPSVKFPGELDKDTSLVGRPYIAGIFDCGTLCRDYFFRENSIELSYRFEAEYLKPAFWPKAILKFLNMNSFQEVSRGKGFSFQKNDLILINYLHQENAHGLVVISEDLELLDQRETSRIIPLGEVYNDVSSIWRRSL